MDHPTYSPIYQASSTIPRKPITYYGKPIRILGEGAYGIVSKVQGPSGSVAVKTVKYSEDDIGVYTPVLRECAILLRCNHPNIIPLIDIIPDVVSDNINFVLPLALFDLKTLIDTGGLTDHRKKYITYQILSAFSYLHNKDILHRDLKPQNVLVFDNDLIKITDFGLSRPTGCIFTKGFTLEVYTIWYRPIELLAEDIDSYDTSADIWSIGCVLYELWTGKVLFKANGRSNMIYTILKTLGSSNSARNELISLDSKKLTTLISNLPQWNATNKIINKVKTREVAHLIVSTLKYDPKKRPTASELLNIEFFDDVRDPNGEVEPLGCLAPLYEREWYPGNTIHPKSTITKDMILKLKDWLLNVRKIFKIIPEIFIYSQHLLDWVLGVIPANKYNLQMLGCICLSIAESFLHARSHSIDDFIDISANSFTNNDFILKEYEILEILNWDLILSISSDFIVPEKYDDKTLAVITLTLISITFSDVRFLLLPSEQCNFAEMLSRVIIKEIKAGGEGNGGSEKSVDGNDSEGNIKSVAGDKWKFITGKFTNDIVNLKNYGALEIHANTLLNGEAYSYRENLKTIGSRSAKRKH